MPDNNMFKLTKRELEIAELIIKGYTNKQIAELTNISIYTVKTHISNIFCKLNAKNRANAAFLLLQHLKF